MQWEKLEQIAYEVIEETLAALPQEVKLHAEKLPLILEGAPSEEMQEDGIDQDTLGLFLGESLAEIGESASPMPAQIVLFLENIWEFSEARLDEYREEVRVTLLHEIGHYFGWDEEDLFDRDLD